MTEPEAITDIRVADWASIEVQFAGHGAIGAGGALLLGNGFSSNIWSAFGYATLLDRSNLAGTASELFRGRFNFETVLAELSIAEQVVAVADPSNHGLRAHLGHWQPRSETPYYRRSEKSTQSRNISLLSKGRKRCPAWSGLLCRS